MHFGGMAPADEQLSREELIAVVASLQQASAALEGLVRGLERLASRNSDQLFETAVQG